MVAAHGALLATSAIMVLRIEELASHVAAHAGVSAPLAEYALRAIVSGIGAYLQPSSRRLIAEELPPVLASALESATGERRPLEDRVQLTGMTPGRARELVASVCRVLAEELSKEAVGALRSSLPQRIADWFAPPAPAIEHHASSIHRQSNSVAEPNPHGDIKLSSGRRRAIDKPN